jgi:hypothetical protein
LEFDFCLHGESWNAIRHIRFTPKRDANLQDDLHFTVVINNPDIPKFVSGDRLKGTPEEYKTAVVNSLGVYGKYTIDENGDFLEEHALGSTFQNMNGTIRGRNEVTEKVDGNRMMENLKVGDGINLNVIWQRAQ